MERDAGHGIVFSLLQIQWPTTVFLSFAVMLSWCFLPFFHHICASTFRDENSEKKKKIRAQTLQEVSLSLFSLMALISFSFSLLKGKEEL